MACYFQMDIYIAAYFLQEILRYIATENSFLPFLLSLSPVEQINTWLCSNIPPLFTFLRQRRMLSILYKYTWGWRETFSLPMFVSLLFLTPTDAPLWFSFTQICAFLKQQYDIHHWLVWWYLQLNLISVISFLFNQKEVQCITELTLILLNIKKN